MGGVLAAPGLQSQSSFRGVIQSITLETNTATGVTLVSVVLVDTNQMSQTIRVSLETAITHGFVVLNGDGKPFINNAALGQPVEIDPANIIPIRQETQHPVGSALSTFFSDLAGIDYETIMIAHEQGAGFGVIAQALWLTTKLEGNAEIFEALMQAKQTSDFSAFILEDGSSPQNWGQLRKAILSTSPNQGSGVVLSDLDNKDNGNGQDHNGNGSDNSNGHGQGNDSNDSNNDPGNGQGNNGNGSDHGNGNNGGNGNGNGNGGGNGNGKEK